MVECTRCGCRNDNESRFCAACGFSLLAPRISRVTPASGFAAIPGIWQSPSAPIAQAGLPAYANVPSSPIAAPSEAEWNLVQRRAAYAPEVAAVPQQPMPVMPQGAAPQQVPQPAIANSAPWAYNAPPVQSPPLQSPPPLQGRSTTPPVGQTEPPRNLPAVLMGFLVSFDGNELGRFWPLYQGLLIVGRAQAAEGLDVAIDHGATSARHAQLISAATPSRLSVQDLGSTNGTFINDQRLAPAHAQMVAHGDQIRFGGFTVRVVLVH